MRSRQSAALVLAVPALAVSLLAAGCGGSSPSPGVATVATTGTAATTTTAPPPGASAQGPSGAPQGGQFSAAMKVGNAIQGAKFSACMRKHGVSNFPDPGSQGVIRFGSSMGIDPNSPTFRSARSACQKLLPNGGQPTPAQRAKQQQQLLAFSACMRAHGIEDFPDPSNGGLQIHVSPGSDLDPNNPLFRQAQKACGGLMPGQAGGTASTGGGG